MQTPNRWPASVVSRSAPDDQLDDVTEGFRAIRIERYPISTMMRAVLDLRAHYTAYEAVYVVLAQALAAPLISADAKLLKSSQSRSRCAGDATVPVVRPRQDSPRRP